MSGAPALRSPMWPPRKSPVNRSGRISVSSEKSMPAFGSPVERKPRAPLRRKADCLRARRLRRQDRFPWRGRVHRGARDERGRRCPVLQRSPLPRPRRPERHGPPCSRRWLAGEATGPAMAWHSLWRAQEPPWRPLLFLGHDRRTRGGVLDRTVRERPGSCIRLQVWPHVGKRPRQAPRSLFWVGQVRSRCAADQTLGRNSHR